MSQLGTAKNVKIDKDDTKSINGAGKQKDIDETSSDYDREKLQERLAKIAGGIDSCSLRSPY